MVNRADETARVLMLSTRRWPAVAVYPDSDKVGVFGDDPGARRHGPPLERRGLLGRGALARARAQATAVSCSS